jgi:hypothetical protein
VSTSALEANKEPSGYGKETKNQGINNTEKGLLYDTEHPQGAEKSFQLL